MWSTRAAETAPAATRGDRTRAYSTFPDRATMPSHSLLLAAILGAAIGGTLAGGGGCSAPNIHDRDETREKPCATCHESAYGAAKNPVHTDVMPTTCDDCHSTSSWTPGLHLTGDKHPWFPLANQHGRACVDCHQKGVRVGDTSKACISCHQKDMERARKPIHTTYPIACQVCHNERGWKPSVFNRPWPLANKHAK